MRTRSWRRSRFDEPGDEPLGPLSNLADIMLVFAVGLIAGLVTLEQTRDRDEDGQPMVEGDELPELPDGIGEDGSGYESVGQVYRDPETGDLIMVGPDGQ